MVNTALCKAYLGYNVIKDVRTSKQSISFAFDFAFDKIAQNLYMNIPDPCSESYSVWLYSIGDISLNCRFIILSLKTQPFDNSYALDADCYYHRRRPIIIIDMIIIGRCAYLVYIALVYSALVSKYALMRKAAQRSF